MTATSPDHKRVSTESPHDRMTAQQVNVIINRILQLSLEPLPLPDYLDQVIFLLTAAPWLAVKNKGAIFLWDENAGILKLTATENFSPDHLERCQTINLGQCLCGRSAESLQTIVTQGLDERHEILPSDLGDHRDFCIPLRTEDRLLGVLHLYPLPDHRFDDEELTFFRAIANTLSSAIIRSNQEQQLLQAKAKAEKDAHLLAKQHEELLAANRLQSSVEHITRHDLKTPLTGIISFADILLERPDLDEEMRQYVKYILDSGYRALHMVNLSLYLFQMEQKSYDLRPEIIDLVPVIKKIHKELVKQVETLRSTINYRLDNRPLADGDRFLFLGEELLAYSMMANLVKNAVEATLPGQEITVTMTPLPSQARVEIHNAQPVDPQIMTRFFDKFVSSGKKFGTGLGTYSAKLIAETMKGTITMQSSPTEGTTLTIHLPAPDLFQS